MRKGAHTPTRSWLAERGISAWQWPPRARYEQLITTQIRDLLDPGADLTLALIVRDAILTGVDKRITASAIGHTPLWGYETSTKTTPDLCLLDADNQIRVVVEHKCGADPNSGSYPEFNTLTRFNDPIALSLPTRPANIADVGSGPWWQGLWQIDYYRCTPHWIRDLGTGEPVTLRDATAVLWILLDIDGRDARDLFWDGHTSCEWITTSYQQFVLPLISAYDEAFHNRLMVRASRLEKLLRMIGS